MTVIHAEHDDGEVEIRVTPIADGSRVLLRIRSASHRATFTLTREESQALWHELGVQHIRALSFHHGALAATA